MQFTTRIARRAEWAQLLKASGSDYSLSQTYEFGEALANAYTEYSYEPRVFEFSDGASLLLPLMRVKSRLNFLRCFEAMPFSLKGAPVCVNGTFEGRHFSAALESLRADRLFLNSCGLRSMSNGVEIDWLAPSEDTTHMLNLAGGFEHLWSNCFEGKVRNQCRSAERKGLKIRIGESADDFETYYSIYVASVRRWGRKEPPYPQVLFQSLSSLAGKGVELRLALVEDRAVAGVLLLHGCRAWLYWGGAMLKEYGGYSGTTALLRSAIEDACERGIEWFDFGASGDLDSVRVFKESFGAQPFTYRNYSYTTTRYRLIMKARRALAASF